MPQIVTGEDSFALPKCGHVPGKRLTAAAFSAKSVWLHPIQRLCDADCQRLPYIRRSLRCSERRRLAAARCDHRGSGTPAASRRAGYSARPGCHRPCAANAQCEGRPTSTVCESKRIVLKRCFRRVVEIFRGFSRASLEPGVAGSSPAGRAPVFGRHSLTWRAGDHLRFVPNSDPLSRI